MRSPRAAVDLRVVIALAALVALGSGAMGVVLSVGLHAVGAHHGGGPRAGTSPLPSLGDGAVVVPQRTPHATRPHPQPTGTLVRVVPEVAQPRRTPAVVAVAAPAPAVTPTVSPAPAVTPPTPTPSPSPPSGGINGGGGLQPSDPGQPTQAAYDPCASGNGRGRTVQPAGDAGSPPVAEEAATPLELPAVAAAVAAAVAPQVPPADAGSSTDGNVDTSNAHKPDKGTGDKGKPDKGKRGRGHTCAKQAPPDSGNNGSGHNGGGKGKGQGHGKGHGKGRQAAPDTTADLRSLVVQAATND